MYKAYGQILGRKKLKDMDPGDDQIDSLITLENFLLDLIHQKSEKSFLIFI